MDFAVEWRTKKRGALHDKWLWKRWHWREERRQHLSITEFMSFVSFMEAIFGVMKFKEGRKLIDLRWFWRGAFFGFLLIAQLKNSFSNFKMTKIDVLRLECVSMYILKVYFQEFNRNFKKKLNFGNNLHKRSHFSLKWS